MKRAVILIFILTCVACTKTQDNIVTVTWWQFWAEPYQKPVIQDLIRKFELENPGIKIQMTELTWQTGHDKITAAFAANRAPDVVELGSDWIYEFIAGGVIKNITPQTDSIHDLFWGWEMATVDSQIYAFPWMLGSRVIFINNDHIQQPINDWNQWLAAVKAAHKPESGIYGFGNTKREPHQLYKKILPFFWSNGGDIILQNGKSASLNDERNVHALEFYLKLCELGLLESQKNLDDYFTQGKIGCVISGGWLIKKITDQNPGLNYTVLPMPKTSLQSEIPGYSFLGGEFLAVNTQSENAEAAIRFIRFLMRKDNVLPLSTLSKVTTPAAKDGIDDDYFQNAPFEKILYQQMLISKPSPLHPKWTVIERILEEEVEQAMYRNKTARQALNDAQKRVEDIVH
ncbi:extracellular solute-binding protein [bacterium]|nr:extracellular solute-binding protein [bacterium]